MLLIDGFIHVLNGRSGGRQLDRPIYDSLCKCM